MTNTAKLFTTLSEARERLNAIIEHSFDGIFITDAKANVVRECKIVCVNRYCMNLLYAPYWGKQR